VLQWKLSLKDFSVIGIIKNKKLVGFCASLYSEIDKQWLICDILAGSDEALEVTIKASCNQARIYKQTLKDPDFNLRKVAILATPIIEKVVSQIPFQRDNYDFSIVIHILNSKLDKKELAPRRWYVSAND
jgi:hypothetical protein